MEPLEHRVEALLGVAHRAELELRLGVVNVGERLAELGGRYDVRRRELVVGEHVQERAEHARRTTRSVDTHIKWTFE